MESAFGNGWRFPRHFSKHYWCHLRKFPDIQCQLWKAKNLNVFINYFTSILYAFQTLQISVAIRIFAFWAIPALQRQITITLGLTLVGQVARKASQLNLFDGTKAVIPMKETSCFRSYMSRHTCCLEQRKSCSTRCLLQIYVIWIYRIYTYQSLWSSTDMWTKMDQLGNLLHIIHM